MRRLLLLALLSLAAPAAEAQDAPPSAGPDAVRLAEILPALADTELGALELGPAPPPGSARLVRRSEVLAALRAAGRDPRGLAIPRAVRIRREARSLDPDALAALSRAAVAEHLAPCELEALTVQGPATVAPGELAVTAEGAPPSRSGTTAMVLVLEAAGREVRVPARARVSCPPPVVAPGARLRLVARFGAVEASAPGVARQPGRVGDVIRVQSLHSRASLRARVVDADTAEVIP